MPPTYHLSKFTRIYYQDAYCALFDGLTLKKIYAPSELIGSALSDPRQAYSRGANRIVDTLIDEGFLVDHTEERRRFEALKNKVGRLKISNMVMLVSNDCNYRCRYCQIEQNIAPENKHIRMPVDVAANALKYFKKNADGDDRKTITITGGEPLLNFVTVKWLIEHTKQIPNSRVVLFTNGSLVRRDTAKFLAENDVLVLVSLDGRANAHDLMRVREGGGGTYSESVRGYHLLKAEGCQVGISAVAGRHNSDRLPELVTLFLNLAPGSVGLNFGHYLIDKPNAADIGMDEFADMLIQFYRSLRRHGIYVENIGRFIIPFCEQRARATECQAQGRGFVVDSRGKIGVCKSLLVSDLVTFDMHQTPDSLNRLEIFRQWADRSPVNIAQCRTCSYIGICGGGCTYDAFCAHDGNIMTIDQRICRLTARIVEFLLWDLFAAIKDKVAGEIYRPTTKEQLAHFLPGQHALNRLHRSVGHEKD
jgi:uncharacterized protein